MTKSTWPRITTTAGAVLLAVSLLLSLAPGSASGADVYTYTAKATARGAQIKLGGTILLDAQTDFRKADTQVNGGAKSGPAVASLIGLPLLADLLSAGVIAQDVFVDATNGTSKACSGLVGPGGVISVDATPQGCIVADPQGPGGVVVNLTPLGLVRARIDGVYGECTASAGPPATVTGQGRVAHIVIDIAVTIPILNITFFQPIAELPINTAPNSQVLFPPVLSALNSLVSLRVNEQTISPANDEIDVTALHLTVLGLTPDNALLDVKLGQAHCGQNTATLVATTTSSTGPSSSSSSSSSSSTSSSSSSTSTTAASTTTSTIAATTTSSSSTSSSSTSTTAAAVTTTKPAAPLARTGSNSGGTVTLAIALLGVGMVITGSGMQLGIDGRLPRRRR